VARWIDHAVEVRIHPVSDYSSSIVFPCQPDHLWTNSSGKGHLMLIFMIVMTKDMIHINAPIGEYIIQEMALSASRDPLVPRC